MPSSRGLGIFQGEGLLVTGNPQVEVDGASLMRLDLPVTTSTGAS